MPMSGEILLRRLPSDLWRTICCEWLGSWGDLASLDVAFCSHQIRPLYLSSMTSLVMPAIDLAPRHFGNSQNIESLNTLGALRRRALDIFRWLIVRQVVAERVFSLNFLVYTPQLLAKAFAQLGPKLSRYVKMIDLCCAKGPVAIGSEIEASLRSEDIAATLDALPGVTDIEICCPEEPSCTFLPRRMLLVKCLQAFSEKSRLTSLSMHDIAPPLTLRFILGTLRNVSALQHLRLDDVTLSDADIISSLCLLPQLSHFALQQSAGAEISQLADLSSATEMISTWSRLPALSQLVSIELSREARSTPDFFNSVIQMPETQATSTHRVSPFTQLPAYLLCSAHNLRSVTIRDAATNHLTLQALLSRQNVQWKSLTFSIDTCLIDSLVSSKIFHVSYSTFSIPTIQTTLQTLEHIGSSVESLDIDCTQVNYDAHGCLLVLLRLFLDKQQPHSLRIQHRTPCSIDNISRPRIMLPASCDTQLSSYLQQSLSSQITPVLSYERLRIIDLHQVDLTACALHSILLLNDALESFCWTEFGSYCLSASVLEDMLRLVTLGRASGNETQNDCGGFSSTASAASVPNTTKEACLRHLTLRPAFQHLTHTATTALVSLIIQRFPRLQKLVLMKMTINDEMLVTQLLPSLTSLQELEVEDASSAFESQCIRLQPAMRQNPDYLSGSPRGCDLRSAEMCTRVDEFEALAGQITDSDRPISPKGMADGVFTRDSSHNHLTSARMRTLKSLTLHRCQHFTPCALLDFVTRQYAEAHLRIAHLHLVECGHFIGGLRDGLYAEEVPELINALYRVSQGRTALSLYRAWQDGKVYDAWMDAAMPSPLHY